MVDLSPYATAKPLFGVLPTWLSPDDAVRIEAYAMYEGMYRNVPDTYKIIQRGTEQNPIYVPCAKTIIEAHGGEITVQSTEGVGTTFRVALPIDVVAVAAA